MKNKFQKFWNMSSDTNRPEILNMYVYGEIKSSRDWWFGDASDVVTGEFLKDLKNYPDASRINVYINSPGGEVFAAAAIKNQLKAHNAEVHTYIDGIAASAATVIAMAGDTVHMSRASLMMIHNPLTGVRGDAKQLLKAIDILNKVKETILATYKEQTKLSDEELGALMDEETWLTADEALEKGFIDEIIEDNTGTLNIEDDAENFVFNGVSMSFSNFIDADKLKAKLQSLEPYINKEGGTNPMTFEEILNAMQADQQSVVNSHIQAAIDNAVATKQSAWDAEKGILENNLTVANTKIKTLEDAANAPQGDDPEEAILNSLPENARAMYVQAKADAIAAQNALNEMKKVEAFGNFKNSMAAYGSLPITEENMQDLFELKNSNAEQFTTIENLLKVANAAMEAGFTPAGSDAGVPAATNAYQEMENRITALRKDNPTMSYNDAMTSVIANDPDLYNRYRDER